MSGPPTPSKKRNRPGLADKVSGLLASSSCSKSRSNQAPRQTFAAGLGKPSAIAGREVTPHPALTPFRDPANHPPVEQLRNFCPLPQLRLSPVSRRSKP
ncbi:hypothetical protein CIRG_06074 [Coccidioides immitis RMSCC 2394]|uniref:Uncharacterized protein n=1 Tax=Coccidioides immitis RMSCC 2394 TaxID=404692 RepID=A0A0J6YHL8_COCIT|nr:hypothetical protein CIRG_06074 [Coccidioides immitis RMSCC 2394]